MKGAKGGFAHEVVRQRNVCKLIKHKSYMNG